MKDNEDDKIPKKLDFKMTEQMVRCLVMLSLIEGNHYARVQRYLEAFNFVYRALYLWFDTLYEAYKLKAYQAMIAEEKQHGGSVDRPAPIDLGSFNPDRPICLQIPTDPILMVQWVSQLIIPNNEFNDLMKIALSKPKMMNDVPSTTTLPALQLTIHYLMILSESLRSVGLCKYALFIYAFIRLIIIYIQPDQLIDGSQALITTLHFKCMQVLVEVGLHDDSMGLSSSLSIDKDGKVMTTVGEFLAKVNNHPYV